MDVFGEETSNEAYLVRPGTHTQLPGKLVNHSTSYILAGPTGMKNYEPRPPIIRTLGLASAIGNTVLTAQDDAWDLMGAGVRH